VRGARCEVRGAECEVRSERQMRLGDANCKLKEEYNNQINE